jgi:hypothetical protein
MMDLQDLKDLVCGLLLEKKNARADDDIPSASEPEKEATSSESQQADNMVEFPTVSVHAPVTHPKPRRKKPALTKEEQIRTTLEKRLDALNATETLTQELQTERDNLTNQIRTIKLQGFESWEKAYGITAPSVSDQPVKNDKWAEPDELVSISTAEMEIPTPRETASVQSVTTPTAETKTVRELTREKLERALEKSGNPRSHNVDDILIALEANAWDIRNRQEQTLANTLAKCETVEALMKVFANNGKKVTW